MSASASLPQSKFCSQKGTACLVTDFGGILTLQTDNGLFNVYPAINFVY